MATIVRAALLLATIVVTISTLTSTVEAQILRRLRNNIRANIAIQPNRTPIVPQFQRPPIPTQIAPQPNAQYGQQLTPYSRLNSAQRQIAAADNARRAQAAAQANPNAPAASSGPVPTTNVRIVTYYDPRTGRTFQRRYVIPPTPNSDTNVANANVIDGKLQLGNQQLATRETAARAGLNAQANRLNATAANINIQDQNSVLSQSNSQQPQFAIAPLSSEAVENRGGEETFLPELAGPSIAAADSTSNGNFSSPTTTNEDLRVDTSVMPASATAAEDQSIEISSASSVEPSDDSPVVFSVLERDNAAAPEEADIELDTDSDVDAFFNN